MIKIPAIDIISPAISAILGDITIEVTPDRLYAAADEVLNTVNTLRGRFDSLNSRVKGMKNYWEGTVSNSRQNTHQRSEQQMEEMLNTLSRYAQELKQIASNYTQAESKNTEDSASLPSAILT